MGRARSESEGSGRRSSRSQQSNNKLTLIVLILAIGAFGYFVSESRNPPLSRPTEQDLAIIAGNQEAQDQADLVTMADTVETFEDVLEDMARRAPTDPKLQMLSDVAEFTGDLFDDAKDPLQSKPSPRWTLLLKWVLPDVLPGVVLVVAGLLAWCFLLLRVLFPGEQQKLLRQYTPTIKESESARIKKQAEKLFDALDANSDGSLDYNELSKVHGSDKMLKEFFEMGDTNEDSLLSPSEWCAYFLKLSKRKSPKAAEVLLRHWQAKAERDGYCIETIA